MAKITITLGDHSTERNINDLGKNAASKQKSIKTMIEQLCEETRSDYATVLQTFTYQFSSEKSFTETENALIQAIEKAINIVRNEPINTNKNVVPSKKEALITPTPIVPAEQRDPLQQTELTPPPPPPPPKRSSFLSTPDRTIENESKTLSQQPTIMVQPSLMNEKKQTATTPFSWRDAVVKNRPAINGGASNQGNLEPFPCQLKLITDAKDAGDEDVLYVYFNRKEQLEFSFRTNFNEVKVKLLEDPNWVDVHRWGNYTTQEEEDLSDSNEQYPDNEVLYFLKTAIISKQNLQLIDPKEKKAIDELFAYASKFFPGKKLTMTSAKETQLNTNNGSNQPATSAKRNKDFYDLEQHFQLRAENIKSKIHVTRDDHNSKWKYGKTLFAVIGRLALTAKQKMQARVGTPPQVIPQPPAPYTKASVQLGDDHFFFNRYMKGPISVLLDVFQQLGVNPSDPKRIKLHFFETDQAQAFKTHFIQSHENRNQAKQDGKVLPANVLWSSEPPLEAEQTAVIIDTPYWPHDEATLHSLLEAVTACNINVNQIYLRADEETLALFSSLKERFLRVSTPLSLPKSLDFSVYLHNDDDDSEDEFSLSYTRFTEPSGFFGPYESIDDPFSEETKHEDPSSTPRNTSPEQTEPRASASGNFSQPSAREDKKDTNSESTESNESEINPAPSTSFSFLLNAMAQNKVATSASLALMIGGIGLACAGIVLFPGTVPLALIIAGLASVVAGIALSSRILTTGSLGFHSRGTTEPPLINDSEHSAESESQDQYRIYTL